MTSLEATKPVVIITGSTGLIGSQLVQTLRDNYRVVGMDLNEPEVERLKNDWVHCDLTDDKSVREALSQVANKYGDDIASVIHLAAYYDFSGEPSSLYRDLTVEGTRRLLREITRFKVEQFVFSSTLLVMKSADDEQPIDEESSVDAEWDYPLSKLITEQVIHKQSRTIPTVILRIAGVYDDDCRCLPIAQQIRRIYERQLESFVFPGDKEHGQAFIHLSDLAECFQRVLAKRKELNSESLYLIGEEDVMSYEELQDDLGKLIHGKEWPTIRIPKVAAKTGAWIKEQLAEYSDAPPFIKPWMIDLADQNYPVDLHRARTELGWKPCHTLRKTLPTMVSRLQKNPVEWYKVNGLPVPDAVETAGSGGASKA